MPSHQKSPLDFRISHTAQAQYEAKQKLFHQIIETRHIAIYRIQVHI